MEISIVSAGAATEELRSLMGNQGPFGQSAAKNDLNGLTAVE
jgi:hypothetical protein